jgi:hypothetical protein
MIEMVKSIVGVFPYASVITTVHGIHPMIDMVKAMVGVISGTGLMTTELRTDPMIDLRRITLRMNPAARWTTTELKMNPDGKGNRNMTETLSRNDEVDATEPETRNQRYQLADCHDERRQGK